MDAVASDLVSLIADTEHEVWVSEVPESLTGLSPEQIQTIRQLMMAAVTVEVLADATDDDASAEVAFVSRSPTRSGARYSVPKIVIMVGQIVGAAIAVAASLPTITPLAALLSGLAFYSYLRGGRGEKLTPEQGLALLAAHTRKNDSSWISEAIVHAEMNARRQQTGLPPLPRDRFLPLMLSLETMGMLARTDEPDGWTVKEKIYWGD